MARVHVFADEAGNFDFSVKPGASRYFILTTVTVDDFRVGDALLALRRQLAWEGIDQVTDDFHATEESQLVRDHVFRELAAWPFRVDSTVLDKSRATAGLQMDEIRFYRTAWAIHFRHLAREILNGSDELLVMTATLGTRKRRVAFHAAVEQVVNQRVHEASARVVSWDAASDPCLWVADYCSWAIQRKWERGDGRSYQLIEDRIASEFNAFAR